MNVDNLLEKIKKNTDVSFLKELNIDLRSDKAFILKAVHNNGLSLEFASDNLQNDREVVLEAIKTDSTGLRDELAMKFVSASLIEDINFIKDALGINPKVYEFLPLIHKDDIEIAEFIIKIDPKAFNLLNEKFRFNTAIAKLAISSYGYNLKYTSEELRNDKNVVILAIANDANAVQFASQNLKSDYDIAILTIQPNEFTPKSIPFAIKFISDEILLNEAKFEKLIEINPLILKIVDLYEVFKTLGEKAFLNQDYAKSIIANKMAFKLQEGGLFLFNIAVCYEKLNELENALLYMTQCYEFRVQKKSPKSSINEALKKIKQYQ